MNTNDNLDESIEQKCNVDPCYVVCCPCLTLFVCCEQSIKYFCMFMCCCITSENKESKVVHENILI